MDRRFLGILAALIIVFIVIFSISSSKTKSPALLGIKHDNQGQTHIKRGQSHPAYNSDPPSSGWHYNDAGAPALWGAYTSEVPDEVFLHNEEHGGVVITYQPSLPKDQIAKLQKLFTSPYSDPNFKPSRAIVTPRSKNKKPIEMAAWTYTFSMDNYDQTKLENFYLQHVSKGPEQGAGPSNTPIIQTSQ
jgi:hypothetical protein